MKFSDYETRILLGSLSEIQGIVSRMGAEVKPVAEHLIYQLQDNASLDVNTLTDAWDVLGDALRHSPVLEGLEEAVARGDMKLGEKFAYYRMAKRLEVRLPGLQVRRP